METLVICTNDGYFSVSYAKNNSKYKEINIKFFFSICLLGDVKKFTKEEQSEIRRRLFLMLLYLFRSPFYDSLTK